VSLLREELYLEGWDVNGREPCYPGSQDRTDLDAAHAGVSLWVEAKWWKDGTLTKVLELDEGKLRRMLPTHRAIALVFTMDEYGLPRDDSCPAYTEGGVMQCIEAWRRKEKVPAHWVPRACACARSPYEGWSSVTGCTGGCWAVVVNPAL
jgi:hypothetical protein